MRAAKTAKEDRNWQARLNELQRRTQPHKHDALREHAAPAAPTAKAIGTKAIGVERAKQHELELREREEARMEQLEMLKEFRDKGSRILSGD